MQRQYTRPRDHALVGAAQLLREHQ